MSRSKRGRYDGAMSAGIVSTSQDSIFYDTNIAVSISSDTGITKRGAHGQNASFTDIRTGHSLVGSTQDYMVSLARGALTTNNIPLFIPVLRKDPNSTPAPITEGGLISYETAMQPGISLTWCGPVYSTDDRTSVPQGISPSFESQYISWPTFGFIPFTVYNTNTNITGVLGSKIATGVINLGSTGGSSTCSATGFVTRLNALMSSAGCPATVSAIVTSTSGTQKLSFSAVAYTDSLGQAVSPTVIFDFTLPSAYNTANTSGATVSKAGVLQACKLLGFTPNATFTIQPSTSGAPVYYTAPRAYQLGFRSTLNLYTYKFCRWVPEDQAAVLPSPGEIVNGYTGTYFDCYSYQHLLNQVLNPTLIRCISDEFDYNQIFSSQCLNRQLQGAVNANCNASLPWSASSTYAASTSSNIVSVTYNGFAYISQYASGGLIAPQIPGTGTSWVSCGEAIWSTWSPTVTYYTGDTVTYNVSASTFNFYTATATATVGVPPPNNAPQWTASSQLRTGLVNATGGTITTVNNMRYHTFTTSGTFTMTSNPSSQPITIFAVGGGGGGGAYAGGGGGAGRFCLVTTAASNVPPGSFTVSIGAGGTGGNISASNVATAATSGGTTTFGGSVSAPGGGAGGMFNTNAGIAGGSGGGGSQQTERLGGTATVGTLPPALAGTVTSNLGNSGGLGVYQSNAPGAGGGGAGAPGATLNQTLTYAVGGAGGDGVLYNNTFYGGGGGGAAGSATFWIAPGFGGTGGKGGGGNGANWPGLTPSSNPAGSNGTANTGGGGGGAYYAVANTVCNGGNGGSGIVIVAYPFSTVLASSQPVIGTLPTTVSFNSSTSLFSLNVDSYGFGGTQATNGDDGYFGFNDDAANIESTPQQLLTSSYDDQARDSWGLTGACSYFTAAPYTIARAGGQCFDERMVFEADDYFHALFGNWPALRLLYTDPRTNIQTSYVRYLPQATNAGLNVPQPLPLFTPTAVTSGYLPYGRVAGNQPYLYTFPQDYPSIGNMWQPIDTIVVATSSVPLVDDQSQAPNFLGDTAYSQVQGSSQTLKILAEFVVKQNLGQEYRSEIIFEPQQRLPVDMKSSSDFKQFDYGVFLRLKQSQALRPLSLSNGGNLNMRFMFEAK